jgi:hypothetical protein
VVKAELHTVKVGDIVEFPIMLGNRCLLLQELGFNAYWNTEEELLEALSGSASNPKMLEICLSYSPCRRFWEEFGQGRTPFIKSDPIRLTKYGNRYWISEGKHRVCLAKRAGVESLEAFVYCLQKDTMSLLLPEGTPGRFRFSCTIGNRKFQGTIAYLQVHIPHGLMRFDPVGFQSIWLDVGRDTSGQFVKIMPGVEYRVSTMKKRKKLGLFRQQDEFCVESEVIISPGHPKTKVWLLQASANDVFNFNSPSFRTIYRRGCWRQGHLLSLSRVLPNPYSF